MRLKYQSSQFLHTTSRNVRLEQQAPARSGSQAEQQAPAESGSQAKSNFKKQLKMSSEVNSANEILAN